MNTNLETVGTPISSIFTIPDIRAANLGGISRELLRAEIGRMVAAGELDDDFIEAFHNLAAANYPMAAMVTTLFDKDVPADYFSLEEGLYFRPSVVVGEDPIIIYVIFKAISG